MSSPSSSVDVFLSQLISLPGGAIRLRDERNQRHWHETVAPFQIAPVPVTNALFRAVSGGAGGDPDLPVTDISWREAIAFCDQLSLRLGLRPCYRGGEDPDGLDVVWDRGADGVRLPTEAEWEWACRAGSAEPRYGPLDDIAWHAGNAGGHAQPVGTRQPNAWGLYDTIGNVWEWCWDIYDSQIYGPYRVFRGGGWADAPRACRASCRRRSHPRFRIDDLGFRLVRSPGGGAAQSP